MGDVRTEILKGCCKKNTWFPMSVLFAESDRPNDDTDSQTGVHQMLMLFQNTIYMTVKNTPLADSNGKDRLPDDWKSKSNISTLFEQTKLYIEDTDAIEEFSQKFSC